MLPVRGNSILTFTVAAFSLSLLILLAQAAGRPGSGRHDLDSVVMPQIAKGSGFSGSMAVSRGVSMRVLWTISGYKVVGSAGWGEKEAREQLFKPLDIDRTQITFDGKTCRDVIFESKKVNAKEYLDRVYRTTPRALGIEEEVIEVVRTNCDLPGFAEYMRLRDRKLLIHIEGVFFYFEPAVNY